ncbi:reverse transcriptase domain-containing protein [Tanacetum coccineum]
MGECRKTQTVIMKFTVVKSPSPYNALLDRTGMRSLRAVASTIHSMMNFPTSNGIATISTTRETLRECRQIKEAQDLSQNARVTDPTPVQTSSKEPMQLNDMEERRKLDKKRKPPKSSAEKTIVVNDNYPEQLVTIGGGLSAECRHAVIHTLRKNVDIFAWTPADMTGIPRAITEHSLDTYPHIEPKAQKKRSLAPDRRKVVTDKVNEWLKAGIIRRVGYPTWVANPVLVKKVDGSWRMCIDFKDLNKACPKDLYPLPEMTKKDEEKTAFHTEEGVFCYTKIPFGLKNAGTTYQWLVDSAFKEQIWVNLEAYVDDMVIKSMTEQDIIKDIEQTFSTLRRINMKLNPKKFSFGMEEGKFLGYIVTSEGIRANLEKAKAVMNMPSPKTLKQMQSLSGKLAALNRFLSKWTEAAEAAFLEMKKLVSELPTLTTPKKDETLMMYLAAANEAVSAVLLTERDERQMPIHYVITDSPIGQVLNNLGVLGRLAKWTVELGAYGITYVPRVAVKGQVLADFLADAPTKINVTPKVASNPRVEDIPESSNARENLTPGPRAWRLYTDGALNNKGSKASLILIASDDVEYSYALRLNFSNSNNDAEYEALLAGLWIAKEMQLAGAFNRFRITHIPRAENKKADALSKLAAVQFDHLSKEVLVEVLNERSVEAQEVNMVVEEEGLTWMTPIRNYLEKGKLPEDHVDARTLMEKIGNYMMEGGVLYRKSCLVPLMRYVGPLQANYIIRKVYMGSFGMHDGPRQVVAKAMNLGYYWPSMHRDVRELIRACDDCQAHASVPRLPKADMISVTSAWPFMNLTYGTEAVIPVEIGMPTHRTSGVNQRTNDQELRLNLDLLDERREIAAIREVRYKQQVEKYYNKKKGGEQTLLPFAHNKYSPVSSYIGWRKQHENINLNVASKCIRAQAVPVGKGLPHALAHGLQPESCCGKTGPYWLNRPDPYKSRHLSDK